MLLYKVVYDHLLRRVVVYVNGREVFAVLVDKDDLAFVSAVKVFFDLLGQALGLNGICKDHDAVKMLVVDKLVDGGITECASLCILVFDVHGEDGHIVIAPERFLKKTLKEQRLSELLRLRDKYCYLLTAILHHTYILCTEILIRN